jgi:hypothetical protein
VIFLSKKGSKTVWVLRIPLPDVLSGMDAATNRAMVILEEGGEQKEF